MSCRANNIPEDKTHVGKMLKRVQKYLQMAVLELSLEKLSV